MIFLSKFRPPRGPDIRTGLSAKDDHGSPKRPQRFTRLLLEAEPVMLRSILVVVPNRTDARDILQETAVAL